MNKVSTNGQVINSYLKQLLPELSNPIKSLWFKENKLYSYNSLLAIIKPQDKVLFIDCNIRNYSNTTTKQTYKLIQQASNFTIYSIPLEVNPKIVVKYYFSRINHYIDKFKRAKTNKDLYKNYIKSLLEETESYIAYMKIDKRSKECKCIHKVIQQLFKHKIL